MVCAVWRVGGCHCWLVQQCSGGVLLCTAGQASGGTRATSYPDRGRIARIGRDISTCNERGASADSRQRKPRTKRGAGLLCGKRA